MGAELFTSAPCAQRGKVPRKEFQSPRITLAPLSPAQCQSSASIGERGILFQPKLSYEELSETEKCPFMANPPDISGLCFPPHQDKRNVCFSFFTEWTRERQRNSIWKGQNTTDVKCSF